MVVKSKGVIKGDVCGCACHKGKYICKGVFLVLFGLLFLLNSLGVLSDSFTSLAWPVLVILCGVGGVMKSCCKCCNKC